MARTGPAQIAPPVMWREATFDVDGKSVRVQYLSDRQLSNSQIADLVAKGEDYGRAWINDRAQGSARGIANAAELIRNAGEPTEHRTAMRASAKDVENFNAMQARAAVQALGRAGRSVGRSVAELVESAMPTGLIERERAEGRGRGRRGTLVAGTARGEEAAEVESAAETVEVEAEKAEEQQGEAPAATQRRGQATYTTTPHSVMRGSSSVNYEFQVVYDSSSPGVSVPSVDQYGLTNASFFDRPENRAGIVRYRYRRGGVEGAEWGAWQAPGRNGQEFHRDYMKLSRTPLSYEVRDAEGIVARFNLYIDQEAAQSFYGTKNETETSRRIMDELANAPDPIKFLRELQERGLIAGFSTLAGEGAETIWVRGNINNFLASLERTYGRDASRLRVTQA